MENYLLKISGAGNRFLLADRRWFNSHPPKQWTAHSCKTKTSFEEFLKLSRQSDLQRKSFMDKLLSSKDLALTDGLVVLRSKPLSQKSNTGRKTQRNSKKSHSQSTLICDFYNKDGSTAQVCGNGSACLAFYTADIGCPLFSFQLGKEKVQAIQNSKGEWGISLSSSPYIRGSFLYHFQDQIYSCIPMFSGVPHMVIEYPEEKVFFSTIKTELKDLAQDLRSDNPFTNVSFFQTLVPGCLKAITYERGLEDFSSACGTGALAVAFAYAQKTPEQNLENVFVNMPGGTLEVQMKPQITLFSPVKRGY